MNFFHHNGLGNHLLQLCPKVVKHPVYYLLLLLALQPTVGFSLLSDFLPFRPFLTQLPRPSYSHYLYIFFDVLNPSFPWSSSVSSTCWFPLSFCIYSSSFCILSDDRSKASSKTMPPHSAIQSLLLQMRITSPVLKVIQ